MADAGGSNANPSGREAVPRNAHKYSPQGGDVSLGILPSRALANQAAQVGLRITDQGIGMTLSQQRHVFERFYRADSSGKTLGTGLGLSIVREIVSLHGEPLTWSATWGWAAA